MSHAYKAVGWNRHKIVYDIILLASVVLYLLIFMTVAQAFSSNIELRGLRIRAYGSAAFILLHVILSIGPLSRLNRRFLPLLYNRRHMGVTMFCLGLYHAREALTWYHDYGSLDPLVSLLVGNAHYGDFIRFPFEILGLLALTILFLMAATSHDFWLANLTAPVWKALHQGVYLAYGLLVGHVVLGAVQTNKHPFLTVAVGAGLLWIVTIHLIAGSREYKSDRQTIKANEEGFVDACSVTEIAEKRGKVVTISGERVAVFKYDGKIAAVSNVCMHQNGPLGEGKIINGCITCPWHGYNYVPETGASPPPFTEKVPTFDVKLIGDRILVKAIPNLPGTRTEPAVIGEIESA
ncbi:MAG: Rieske 2Fe-2S domain-containing protein [Oscillatoria sp. SIO1A7]|nr:Rieske 2Fe-2S domain-containing protein [Oscillatoria sp. SIO1A7]